MGNVFRAKPVQAHATRIVPTISHRMGLPEDGVEEFRMETQNTPATYASAGGGVISLVGKANLTRIDFMATASYTAAQCHGSE
jgi:hypothetical protein